MQSDREAIRLLLARVREHRLHHNWTQAEMARRVGMNRSSYQNFENGYGNITLTNLVRVLGVLDFTDRLAQLVPPAEVAPTLASITKPRRVRARHGRSAQRPGVGQ